MHCMGFLTETVLGLEAQKYGAAAGNRRLCGQWHSRFRAVGLLVDMITDWSGTFRGPRYITLKGDQLILAPDRRLELLKDTQCPHFPLRNAGDFILCATLTGQEQASFWIYLQTPLIAENGVQMSKLKEKCLA